MRRPTSTSPGTADIAGALRHRRIFISGATGFVGRVLVEKLLWSVPEVGRLLLLIRPDGERSAADRLRDEVLGAELMGRLKALHGDGWEAWAASRVEAVAGDLGEDRFGLDGAAYEALAGRVDMVVASAATVTFDERLDRALELNARGAGRTLALARDAGDVPLLHVSTAFVSGRREGVVPERLLGLASGDPGAGGELDPSAVLAELGEACRRLAAAGARGDQPFVDAGAALAERHGFHDVYTLTKALGELLLARERGAVPLTIVRPGIVESAAAEPAAGWIDAVRVVDPMLVAYGRGLIRQFPGAADAVLDVVPVDHVVHAILAALAEMAELARQGPGAGAAAPSECRVYQVVSSRNPLSLGELVAGAREGFTKTPLRDERGEPIPVAPARFVAPERLLRRLRARRLRVRALPRFLRSTRLGPRLGGAERTLDHFIHLLRVYGPYLDHRARHDDAATRGLWSRLSPADQAAFPFDITALAWRPYLADVHVPGVQRYALHAETGAPSPPRPHDVLAGLHARGEYPPAQAATLFGLFATAARLDPDGVALQICRGGRWLRYTYGQALTATGNIAHGLATRHGIGRGDRVVLWGGGSPEWVLAALAVHRLGAVTVPLDPQWPAREIADAAGLTGAKLICAAPQLAGALRAAGAASCPVVELAAPFVPGPHVGLLPGAAGLAAAGGAGDLASILFTSGTTVAPKAVPLTHANFLANVRSLIPVVRPSRERLLSLLPLHHVFELVMGLLLPLAGGGTISYLAEMKPAELAWTMRVTRPTMLVAVPRLLDLLLGGVRQRVAAAGPLSAFLFGRLLAASAATGGRHGRLLFGGVHRAFGGALRRIAVGGSALAPKLARSYQLLGFAVSEGYGMTEASPVLAVNPWDAVRLGSVGKPLPGVDIEVRPIAGAEAGAGEVWVRGANVMSGYYDNPEATAAVLRDGWLCTGDVGRLDADGYLYLSGRTKDVIVTGAGKNVYPEEVELRYRGIPGVEELVVLGLPDLRTGAGGERVGAVVVPRRGATEADLAEIRATIAARSAGVPSYQQIAQVEVWRGDLPKTTTQKVKRGKLREAVLAGGRGDRSPAPAAAPPPAASAAPARTEAERWVIATLARATHQRPDLIGPADRLAELGVDSLTRVQVIGELEARFGRRVDDAAVASLIRVQDLFDLAPSGPRRAGTEAS